MQYFGLKDMSELPKLKEFEVLEEEHLELFRQHQLEQKKEPHEQATKPEAQEDGDPILEGSQGQEEEKERKEMTEIRSRLTDEQINVLATGVDGLEADASRRDKIVGVINFMWSAGLRVVGV